MKNLVSITLVLMMVVFALPVGGIESTCIDISTDAYGNLFVLNPLNQDVFKFDDNLNFLENTMSKSSYKMTDADSFTVCWCAGELSFASTKTGITQMYEIDEKWEYIFHRDGTTFDGNAKIKSKVMFAKSGIPTIAEDSGLVVDALDGRPGIYSARYAETPELANEKILEEMKGIKERSARFVCSLVFSWHGGSKIFRGIIEGDIAEKPKGSNGFGYDPIFLYDGKHTTAELSKDEKNKISHRGKALRKFAKWFEVNEKLIFPE